MRDHSPDQPEQIRCEIDKSIVFLRNIDVSDSLVLFGEKNKIDSSAGKQTRGLSIKLWVLYQLSYRGIHVSPPNNLATISWPYGHELRWPYICTNLQVVTSPVVEEFIFDYKVPLDCLDILRNTDVSDSLVLFGEKKSTPQPGNKPGTSQLSFECSTNSFSAQNKKSRGESQPAWPSG